MHHSGIRRARNTTVALLRLAYLRIALSLTVLALLVALYREQLGEAENLTEALSVSLPVYAGNTYGNVQA